MLGDIAPEPQKGREGFGNPKSTFRDEDLRALRSPKWHVKLERLFRTVKADVNIVFVNATHDDHYGLGRLYNMRDWSGIYRPVIFEQKFGMLPSNYKNSINVVFTNNEGDERVPLTPHMIAHRLMHALANDPHYTNKDSEIYDNFYRGFKDLSLAFGYVDHHRMGAPSNYNAWKGENLTYNEIYARLSSFGSARNHKILRQGEYFMEIATMYFLRGKIDFDYRAFEYQESRHFGWKNGKTVEVIVTADEYRQLIEEALNNAAKSFDECFAKSVGKLIVF
jgi:hypothetical protein